MKKNYLIFVLSTGLLFTIAFSALRIGFFAYWCLVPFFYMIENLKLKDALYWSYLTGLFVSIGALGQFHSATIIGSLILALIHPLYFSVFALIQVFLFQRWQRRAFWAAPFLWVGIEYLKGLNAVGMNGLFLGLTHSPQISFVRSDFFLNILLISFWLVLLNVLIFRMLTELMHKTRVLTFLAVTIGLFALPWYFKNTDKPDIDKFNDSIEAESVPTYKYSFN